MLISIAQAQLFIFVFTRVMAMILPVPVLGGQAIPAQVRIALGLVLSAILIPWQPLGVDAPSIGLFGFMAGIFRELIIGTLAGMAAVFTFGALQVAGEVMGIGSGFGSSQILNPAMGNSGSAVDQMFVMVGLLFFIMMDGHHSVIQAVKMSFQAIPINQPLEFTDPESLIRLAGQMIATGIQMAFPVMGSLMLADITLGLLARVAPQVQVFFLGLPLKIGLGMIAISFTYAIALPIMQNMYRNLGPRMLMLLTR